MMTGFKSLLSRARTGDSAAHDEIFRLVRPHLERTVQKYADPAHAMESASDFVQEAWLRAWQHLDQFEGANAPTDDDAFALFRAWAGQIAKRLGKNAVRDREAQKRSPDLGIRRLGFAKGDAVESRLTPADPPAPAPGPRTRAEAGDAHQAVRAALARIPDPVAREVVTLHFFEGRTLKEVARKLGVSYDTTRDRYRAAMRILEQELGDLG